MYFYRQRKKVFLSLMFWSVINNLFICQFRKVDSRFRRKKSKAASSLCPETTRPHGRSCVWAVRPADQLTKPVQAHARGRRWRGRFPCSVAVPNGASAPAARTPWNCLVQCFSYFKKVTSNILIRKGYFIFLFYTPHPFPI